MAFKSLAYIRTIAGFGVLICVLTTMKQTIFAQEMFLRTPKTSSFLEGEFAFLECLAANSQITVSWEKDGKLLEPTERIGMVKSGYVFFYNANYEDSGNYSCVATDSESGIAQKASAILEIKAGKKLEEICGIPRIHEKSYEVTISRLTNTHDALKGAHPWHVIFLKNGMLHCSGALLSNLWIATSAHCIESDFKERKLTDYTIKLGKYELDVDEDQEYSLEMDNHSPVVIHPYFDSSTFANDIVLLRLRDPIQFTDYIIPICIPDRELGEQLLTPPTTNGSIKLGTVTGWDFDVSPRMPQSTVLQEIRIPIVDKNVCETSENSEIPDSLFCSGYDRNQTEDKCYENGGAPFVTLHNDRWYLVGLSTRKENCEGGKKFIFFTNVPIYSGWIKPLLT